MPKSGYTSGSDADLRHRRRPTFSAVCHVGSDLERARIEERLSDAAKKLCLHVEADRRSIFKRYCLASPEGASRVSGIDALPRNSGFLSVAVGQDDPVLVRRQRHAHPPNRQCLEPARASRLLVAAGFAAGVARHGKVNRHAVPVRDLDAWVRLGSVLTGETADTRYFRCSFS